MNHTKDHNHEHKQGDCCGGDKHHEQEQPVKEKDGCCDGDKEKKSEADKAEKQGGCCGGKS